LFSGSWTGGGKVFSFFGFYTYTERASLLGLSSILGVSAFLFF
jgi:hypothetical protein